MAILGRHLKEMELEQGQVILIPVRVCGYTAGMNEVALLHFEFLLQPIDDPSARVQFEGTVESLFEGGFADEWLANVINFPQIVKAVQEAREKLKIAEEDHIPGMTKPGPVNVWRGLKRRWSLPKKGTALKLKGKLRTRLKFKLLLLWWSIVDRFQKKQKA